MTITTKFARLALIASPVASLVTQLKSTFGDVEMAVRQEKDNIVADFHAHQDVAEMFGDVDRAMMRHQKRHSPVLDLNFPLMHHFVQNVSRRAGLLSVSYSPCSPVAVCAKKWPHRLGNNLYLLEKLVMYARQENYCYVSVPKGGAIRSLINFPDDDVISAFPAAKEHGKLQCAKIVERSIVDGLKEFTIKDLRSAMVEIGLVGSLSKCPPNASGLLTDETVVMHMRSGDINGGERYPQPPCSYYKLVMLKGRNGDAFGKGVILTEPDKRNPCIREMRDAFPGRIAVLSRSVTADACTMISAKHLAIAFGTWGPALSRLNTNLIDLYVPWGEDGVTAEEYGGQLAGMSKHWYHESVYEGSLGYRQHIFSFPGFTAAQSAFGSQDIVHYPMDRIRERVILA